MNIVYLVVLLFDVAVVLIVADNNDHVSSKSSRKWGDSKWLQDKFPALYSLWESRQWEHLHHPVLVKRHPCVGSFQYKFGHVTAAQWAAEMGTLTNVYAGTTSHFTYHDFVSVSRRFAWFKQQTKLTNVAADKVFLSNTNHQSTHCNNDSQGSKQLYYYYSGNIMNPNFNKLRSRINLQCLLKGVPTESLTTMVWIGGSNITATTHYDAVHNIYTQMVGSKRIRLIPPSSAQDLKLFGSLHPNACQSRIMNLSTGLLIPCEDQFFVSNQEASQTTDCGHMRSTSSSLRPRYVEYILQPGQVLYIPPFWLHEVTSLSPSISLSSWWDPVEAAVMDDIYSKMALPIEQQWSTETTVEAIKLLVSVVTSQLDVMLSQYVNATSLAIDSKVNKTKISKIIRKLLIERYKEDYLLYRRVNKCGILPKHLYCNSSSNFIEDRIEQIQQRGKEFASAFFTIVALPASSLEAATAAAGTCVASCKTNLLLDSISIVSLKVCDWIESIYDFVDPKLHPWRHIVDILEEL